MHEDIKKPTLRDNAGEMDLYELCTSLWKEKWLVLAVTALGLLLAVAYALLATPVYKTEATVIPPRQSDIAAFNLGRLSVTAAQGQSQNAVALSEYTADQVYSVFKRNLLSSSLRNAFFEQYYLPYIGVDMADEDTDARDNLRRDFAEKLIVSQPDQHGRPDYYQVVVELEDPHLAATWANEYVALAASNATHEMVNNVLSEVSIRSRVAERRIRGLRSLAQQQRLDRIARLREASAIASSLGIDQPQATVGRAFADSELAAFVEGDLMYMRGSRALQAELAILEARENDAPFIPELRELESQLAMLRGISVDEDAVSVFTLDGAAEVPETPVKPRKGLAILLGIALGGLLGVGIALLRISLRSSSAKARYVPRR
ncbi:chain-length determining protein [Pseudomonas sp. gcc21]|uniref:Wzz/FepE/Etk N-terminal domain-containing protein n=1 Tax=Pseudomonas sp. gcc21 TaxID=2726989 RepID=UPI0014524106|nr:Wzz/FepE/Etk N-terminal domain-containing protein [Pseudomonas sp. gcc21]QJD58664.1 chain-length determining protein [Pseudomonas sp. gcc21]